ncbi:MAG: glutathione ABC transporter ATP-binding protein [Rhodospirillales bacterium 20-60-12]|nr:MAG: glutathione ABC transporter ATP-binding protein [Rhodospirillales bacterium 20-60-12]
MLKLDDVSVALRRGKARAMPILDHLSLEVSAGKMLALVGESGSGKTIATLATMRLLPRGAKITGRIMLGETDLLTLDEPAMRRVRGRDIGMIFQNPLSALNPTTRIGAQINEAYRTHTGHSDRAARARTLELLGEVGIPDPAARFDDYPHQFSGGMRQRVMIAMALACSPKLLIADEPTTGLDPLVAKQILALLTRLRRTHNMGVLFITHDLSVVEEYADDVHVLYAGRTVEAGTAADFFAAPRHPYSQALLGAIPRLGQARLLSIPGTLPDPEQRPSGCRFAPRCAWAEPACAESYPAPQSLGGTTAACRLIAHIPPFVASTNVAAGQGRQSHAAGTLLEVENLTVRYARTNTSLISSLFGTAPKFTALDNVSFTLGKGECLGIVGESGSGKSTLGRAILQMVGYDGRIILDGEDFTALRGAALRRLRMSVQVVFQDPRESLNPRLRIGDSVAEPLKFMGKSSAARRQAAAGLLERVGLSARLLDVYPHTISGGQAQRVAIARALAAEPRMIVLDEPTSSLDVSTQAMLLNLLKDLAKERGLSYILISHDLAAVSYMADRIAVLNGGKCLEIGPSVALLANPSHDYTKKLVDASPQLRPSTGSLQISQSIQSRQAS